MICVIRHGNEGGEIAPDDLEHDTNRKWLVSAKLRPLNAPKDPVPVVQEVGLDSGTVRKISSPSSFVPGPSSQ